jgi:hypothetical protein
MEQVPITFRNKPHLYTFPLQWTETQLANHDGEILQSTLDLDTSSSHHQDDFDSGYDADDSGNSPAISTQALPDDLNFFSSLATKQSVNDSPDSQNGHHAHNQLLDTTGDSGVSLSASETLASSSESDIIIQCRAPRISKKDRLCNILIELKKNKLSPLDLVTKIVDNSNTEYCNYRIKMYKDSGRYKLERILDMIMNDVRGKVILLDWIRPHALWQVRETVSNEMDVLTSQLHTTTNTITPNYLMTWTLQDNVEHVVGVKTPSLLSIIHAASCTKRSLEKNKKKDTLSVSLLTVLACLQC